MDKDRIETPGERRKDDIVEASIDCLSRRRRLGLHRALVRLPRRLSARQRLVGFIGHFIFIARQQQQRRRCDELRGGAGRKASSDGENDEGGDVAAGGDASTAKTIAQRIDEALEQEFPEDKKKESVGKTYTEKAKQEDVSLRGREREEREGERSMGRDRWSPESTGFLK